MSAHATWTPMLVFDHIPKTSSTSLRCKIHGGPDEYEAAHAPRSFIANLQARLPGGAADIRQMLDHT
eukprot:CAMPEP_0117594336 /NCGR_PEP_ID=MMETSP0784-20121206/73147_1 /TAXON_ID=39447 /ORGANISM="" /LENGTH=66 /DNA_ID=CAMNT_0005396389 /DNA_START=466 /DNA_END=666 /DNA_ORIENTATION=+